MTIGTTIRALRKIRGLTLNQLAAIIESDVGNLSRLERDKQGYSDLTLKRLSDALEVPIARFFLEADDTFAILSKDEARMLSVFRATDDRGRATLLHVAETVPTPGPSTDAANNT